MTLIIFIHTINLLMVWLESYFVHFSKSERLRLFSPQNESVKLCHLYLNEALVL